MHLDNKFLACICDCIQVLSSRACGSLSAPPSPITFDCNRGVAPILRTAVTQGNVLLVAPIREASSKSIHCCSSIVPSLSPVFKLFFKTAHKQPWSNCYVRTKTTILQIPDTNPLFGWLEVEDRKSEVMV